ncbi:hypothetical protein [Nocardia arthritidis]|uniref:Uncharacterized protein n=1 Tax=Nocardia arthritidis TaxID=228602 RepID=A0A6G9YC28_9NOCA|nr:hypothetical protein [Nocardia arthritidis]QIS10627.1 hypothetical protein F5544_13695 [Nocardia arthritidis]
MWKNPFRRHTPQPVRVPDIEYEPEPAATETDEQRWFGPVMNRDELRDMLTRLPDTALEDAPDQGWSFDAARIRYTLAQNLQVLDTDEAARARVVVDWIDRDARQNTHFDADPWSLVTDADAYRQWHDRAQETELFIDWRDYLETSRTYEIRPDDPTANRFWMQEGQ